MNVKKGFTLIEVLISTAILVSALGTLTYCLSQASNLTKTSGNRDIALSAAQNGLEWVVSSQLPNITDYDGQTWPVEGLIKPSGQDYNVIISVAALGGSDGLFDVSATVNWQQTKGRVMSRTLSTTILVK